MPLSGIVFTGELIDREDIEFTDDVGRAVDVPPPIPMVRGGGADGPS